MFTVLKNLESFRNWDSKAHARILTRVNLLGANYFPRFGLLKILDPESFRIIREIKHCTAEYTHIRWTTYANTTYIWHLPLVRNDAETDNRNDIKAVIELGMDMFTNFDIFIELFLITIV